jgi:hypothetical protein
VDALLQLLSPLISGTGPYGALIGAGVMLLVNWLRTRNVLPSAPATPADPRRPLLDALLAILAPAQPAPVKQPDPAPAPAPAIPDEHKRPLLDALLKALGR